MASFRTFSEIVASMLERLKLSQPNLDTKAGTVSRDLFVDIQADQLERLYRSMAIISEKQSLATATGRDLDRIASNFGIPRKSPTSSSGLIVFYTNTITNDITIPTGTIVRSRSGVSFRTIGEFNMLASQKNLYAANANRIRSALNVAGVTSSYAIEVPIQCIRPGKSGNVSSLQIVSSDADADVGVVNLTAMTGGENREADSTFRSRILAIFSGSNTGTANGYRNSALGVDGVLDALVVEPGSSLMLRDGTEVVEFEGGSTKILNSGSGGKVDIYILGRNVRQISESYVYTDLSGSGSADDNRNDVILGISGQDITMTSEERRLSSFKNGTMPLQPVDSIVSVIGSQSGQLVEKFFNTDGTMGGNFELIKDYNPETGGSPFGYDKIHYTSNKKEVSAESITKGVANSSDKLAYSDINNITSVFRDVSVIRENSSTSNISRNTIVLNHRPIVKVSRVFNSTTGEVYSVSSQNINPVSGLNESGEITISGSSLPSQTDTLSVDYVWRHIYDEYTDYYKPGSTGQFRNPDVSDSIDWSTSSGILNEESIVERTDDGLEYKVSLKYDASNILSVFSTSSSESSVGYVSDDLGNQVFGIEIDLDDDPISSIYSIKTSSGMEIYNTKSANGNFSSRKIILPSDSPAEIGDIVIVTYNKLELYSLENTDGSFSGKSIVLPSEDVLISADISGIVNNLLLSGDPVYVNYSANISDVIPQIPLGSLPVLGSETDNLLSDSNGDINQNSNQPIFYNFDDLGNISSISKYSPSRISVDISKIRNPGKVKIIGTTLHKASFDLTALNDVDGLTFNLKKYIDEKLLLGENVAGVGIARINRGGSLDSSGAVDKNFDTLGYAVLDSTFDSDSAKSNLNLKYGEFKLPSTSHNSSISLSSGQTVRVECSIFVRNSFEELYFPVDGSRDTDMVFARIDTISASSGFRDSLGNLTGLVSMSMLNQPETNETYFVDYNFQAPKEGERVVITYLINSLVPDVSVALEAVRPISADILVKEASLLYIDVSGKILINEDSLLNSNSILQDVNNQVSNILNASTLGTTIDYSDVLSVITSISGVDSASISLFNESGKAGRKSFIKALDNQSIAPGSISFEVVSRKKFKID